MGRGKLALETQKNKAELNLKPQLKASPDPESLRRCEVLAFLPLHCPETAGFKAGRAKMSSFYHCPTPKAQVLPIYRVA